MPAQPPYAKQRIAVNAGEWTAIIAPFRLDHWVMRNTSGVALRLSTDPLDPDAEDVLGVNGQESVTVPRRVMNTGLSQWKPARWLNGETVLWVRTTSGSGVIMLTWVQ